MYNSRAHISGQPLRPVIWTGAPRVGFPTTQSAGAEWRDQLRSRRSCSGGAPLEMTDEERVFRRNQRTGTHHWRMAALRELCVASIVSCLILRVPFCRVAVYPRCRFRAFHGLSRTTDVNLALEKGSVFEVDALGSHVAGERPFATNV